MLAHGAFSDFAEFFDIRRKANEPFRVHICTLAHAYGESLEKGELVIEIKNGRPRLKHHENSWPLSPASWGLLLDPDAPPACFAELNRLRGKSGDRATAEEREQYWRHVARAEEILAEAHRAGQLQNAVDRAQGDTELVDAVLQRQSYMLHGSNWRASSPTTGVSSM